MTPAGMRYGKPLGRKGLKGHEQLCLLLSAPNSLKAIHPQPLMACLAFLTKL